MRYVSIFLLAGFVGLAIFGGFSVHTGMQGHASDCIAAIAQGKDCPKQDNALAYLNFHLDAFKIFSSVTSNTSALSFLVIFLSFAAALGVLWGRNIVLPKLSLAYSRLGQSDSTNLASQRKFICWFALHENSPSIF